MASEKYLYIKNDKLIVNSQKHPVLCATCPCNVEQDIKYAIIVKSLNYSYKEWELTTEWVNIGRGWWDFTHHLHNDPEYEKMPRYISVPHRHYANPRGVWDKVMYSKITNKVIKDTPSLYNKSVTFDFHLNDSPQTGFLGIDYLTTYYERSNFDQSPESYDLNYTTHFDEENGTFDPNTIHNDATEEAYRFYYITGAATMNEFIQILENYNSDDELIVQDNKYYVRDNGDGTSTIFNTGNQPRTTSDVNQFDGKQIYNGSINYNNSTVHIKKNNNTYYTEEIELEYTFNNKQLPASFTFDGNTYTIIHGNITNTQNENEKYIIRKTADTNKYYVQYNNTTYYLPSKVSDGYVYFDNNTSHSISLPLEDNQEAQGFIFNEGNGITKTYLVYDSYHDQYNAWNYTSSLIFWDKENQEYFVSIQAAYIYKFNTYNEFYTPIQGYYIVNSLTNELTFRNNKNQIVSSYVISSEYGNKEDYYYVHQDGNTTLTGRIFYANDTKKQYEQDEKLSSATYKFYYTLTGANNNIVMVQLTKSGNVWFYPFGGNSINKVVINKTYDSETNITTITTIDNLQYNLYRFVQTEILVNIIPDITKPVPQSVNILGREYTFNKYGIYYEAEDTYNPGDKRIHIPVYYNETTKKHYIPSSVSKPSTELTATILPDQKYLSYLAPSTVNITDVLEDEDTSFTVKLYDSQNKEYRNREVYYNIIGDSDKHYYWIDSHDNLCWIENDVITAKISSFNGQMYFSNWDVLEVRHLRALTQKQIDGNGNIYYVSLTGMFEDYNTFDLPYPISAKIDPQSLYGCNYMYNYTYSGTKNDNKYTFIDGKQYTILNENGKEYFNFYGDKIYLTGTQCNIVTGILDNINLHYYDVTDQINPSLWTDPDTNIQYFQIKREASSFLQQTEFSFKDINNRTVYSIKESIDKYYYLNPDTNKLVDITKEINVYTFDEDRDKFYNYNIVDITNILTGSGQTFTAKIDNIDRTINYNSTSGYYYLDNSNIILVNDKLSSHIFEHYYYNNIINITDVMTSSNFFTILISGIQRDIRYNREYEMFYYQNDDNFIDKSEMINVNNIITSNLSTNGDQTYFSSLFLITDIINVSGNNRDKVFKIPYQNSDFTTYTNVKYSKPAFFYIYTDYIDVNDIVTANLTYSFTNLNGDRTYDLTDLVNGEVNEVCIIYSHDPENSEVDVVSFNLTYDSNTKKFMSEGRDVTKFINDGLTILYNGETVNSLYSTENPPSAYFTLTKTTYYDAKECKFFTYNDDEQRNYDCSGQVRDCITAYYNNIDITDIINGNEQEISINIDGGVKDVYYDGSSGMFYYSTWSDIQNRYIITDVSDEITSHLTAYYNDGTLAEDLNITNTILGVGGFNIVLEDISSYFYYNKNLNEFVCKNVKRQDVTENITSSLTKKTIFKNRIKLDDIIDNTHYSIYVLLNEKYHYVYNNPSTHIYYYVELGQQSSDPAIFYNVTTEVAEMINGDYYIDKINLTPLKEGVIDTYIYTNQGLDQYRDIRYNKITSAYYYTTHGNCQIFDENPGYENENIYFSNNQWWIKFDKIGNPEEFQYRHPYPVISGLDDNHVPIWFVVMAYYPQYFTLSAVGKYRNCEENSYYTIQTSPYLLEPTTENRVVLCDEIYDQDKPFSGGYRFNNDMIYYIQKPDDGIFLPQISINKQIRTIYYGFVDKYTIAKDSSNKYYIITDTDGRVQVPTTLDTSKTITIDNKTFNIETTDPYFNYTSEVTSQNQKILIYQDEESEYYFYIPSYQKVLTTNSTDEYGNPIFQPTSFGNNIITPNGETYYENGTDFASFIDSHQDVFNQMWKELNWKYEHCNPLFSSFIIVRSFDKNTMMNRDLDNLFHDKSCYVEDTYDIYLHSGQREPVGIYWGQFSHAPQADNSYVTISDSRSGFKTGWGGDYVPKMYSVKFDKQLNKDDFNSNSKADQELIEEMRNLNGVYCEIFSAYMITRCNDEDSNNYQIVEVASGFTTSSFLFGQQYDIWNTYDILIANGCDDFNPNDIEFDELPYTYYNITQMPHHHLVHTYLFILPVSTY